MAEKKQQKRRRRNPFARAGKRRRRSGGVRGFLRSHQTETILTGAGVAMVGGIALGRFFPQLPLWLSPVGVALWLWGWWRNQPVFRWAGMLFIALSVAEYLGLSSGIAAGVQQAAAKLKQTVGAPAAAAQAGAPAPAPASATGTGGAIGQVQQAAAATTALANAVQAVQSAAGGGP